MRKLTCLIGRFRFGTLTEQQIMKKYNSMILQLQGVGDDKQKQSKIMAEMADISIQLKQLRKQQELNLIKDYLKEGYKQSSQSIQKTNQQPDRHYIPQSLIVKKLRFQDKKILMLGVQQQNQDHCIYLKKMIQKMNTRIVLTALPPDMPYFIKTELSFAQQWKKFITNTKYAKQSKFYLNPTPYNISDFCLNAIQKQLVRGSLGKSKEFNQIFYTILQHSRRLNKFVPNALLTPLLISNVQKIYFCDYPILKQRELWAMAIPVDELRRLFKVYHNQLYKNKQMIFDPRILFPKQIINIKFQHMANAIKYASYQSNQPAVFVCPAQYSQMFCQQWKKDKPVTSVSNFSLYANPKVPTTFIDFVQKLVILDIILQPVIDKYYIRNQSFPYTAQQTLGGKQNIGKIFIVWKHFQNIYQQALQKQPNY